MKKTVLRGSVALLAVAALALSGCGVSGSSGSSDSQTGGTTNMSAEIEAVTDEQLQGTTITLSRFFGDCAETTDGVTDISKATSECEAIQILTNQFVAENQWGIKVERLGGATWDSYYDGLNAALGSSDRPDVAVMHGSNLPSYAQRGLLMEVPGGLGIDLADASAPAQEAITYGGAHYAVPFDTHAVISHLNMDLLAEAGLTEADGTYVMPTTVDEFLADAEQFKAATGKTFIDVAMSNDPMASRMWMSLVWQQDADFIDAEAGTASTTTPEANNALTFLTTLVDKGYTDPTHDYDASTQAFLRGESAILYNGVWAVNQYSQEATFNYQVTDAPQLYGTPASWANSHTWTVPVQADGDPVTYRAAFEFTKFLYEHTGDWAIATGHMAASETALGSPEYLAAPHRDQYILTATEYGHMQPRIVQWPAVGDTLQSNLEAAWLNGTDVGTTLATLQEAVTKDLE